MNGRQASPSVTLWASFCSRFDVRSVFSALLGVARRATATEESASSPDLVTDRLEAVIIRHLGGAGRQADDQIHLGPEQNRIAGFRTWRQNRQRAIGIDLDVHENVERGRNGIGRDAERRETRGEIGEAARMRLRVLVNDLERFRTARREHKIVTTYVILDDREHRPAAVRVEDVAFGQVNPIRVINGAARRKPFPFIGEIERDEIGDLFAFEIDDTQLLTGSEFESRAGLWFEPVQCANGHLLFAG